MIRDVAHFLIANGAVRAIVNFAVLGLLGWLVKLAREHVHIQRANHQLLRTDTPGGLADIVNAVNHPHDRGHEA